MSVIRMQVSPPRHAPNFRRRFIGFVICFFPAMPLLASIGVGLLLRTSPTSGLGFAWMLIALTVGLLNFYLSFIRPLLLYWRCGSSEQYRHVTGIPLVGTIVVVIGGLFGFGSVLTACVGLAALLLNTGGSFWLLLATWKDSSFWDA
jgi:hypothetical protein